MNSGLNSPPITAIVFNIPTKESNETKSIFVVKELDFKKLYPQGPFNFEAFAGENINSDKLLYKINDKFAPESFIKKPAKHEKPPLNNIFRTYKLKSNSGDTVATIVLRLNRFPPPPFGFVIMLFFAVIIMAAIVLSILTGFYIKQNFINPFLLISNVSNKIQKGDFSSSIQYHSKNLETNETINVINSMIIGLKEKEELRKNFISSLTHDLRTPLIAQERAIEYIKEIFERLNLEEENKLAQGLYNNNQNLLRMVNLLLQSYHFDSENININISNINLFKLVEDCFEEIKALTLEKHIQLINVVEPNLYLRADAESLKRVLINLVSNSIDSIQTEGKIKIRAKSENEIKIFVEDNGIGITPEDQTHLFEKYFTGKSDKRKIGSGLGLYICKKLVELNKGSIQVYSKVGEYTKFIITLPGVEEITDENKNNNC